MIRARTQPIAEPSGFASPPLVACRFYEPVNAEVEYRKSNKNQADNVTT